VEEHHGKGYKMMSYDAQNDHLNIIDDEHPATNLHHLDKHPYYDKKSHLLGHRGEHWTPEDRIRVKHHHAKLLRNKKLHDRKHHKNHHRNKHDKHHGKILPFNPTLDTKYKEEYLQNMKDLDSKKQATHLENPDHHLKDLTHDKYTHLDHFEPHKTMNKQELRKKAQEPKDTFDKREHKKGKHPKKIQQAPPEESQKLILGGRIFPSHKPPIWENL
jgi:hypothetical protein